MTHISNFHTHFLSGLVVILLCWSSSLLGQEFSDIRFSNLTKAEGLPSNLVSTIIKDHDGFIWVGTNNGLCRYDAPNRFTVFRANDKKRPNGLKSNDITKLMVDSQGNIWIGTRLGGLCRYQPSTDTWKNFFHDPEDEGTLSNNDILSILEDSKGRIWVGTEFGLNFYHPESETFTRFRPDADKDGNIKGRAVLSLLEDHQGRIWLGTWEEALHLALPSKDGDIKKTTFRRIFLNGEWGARNIWGLYQDSEQRIWLASYGAGLFLMELPDKASDHPDDQSWQPTFRNFKADLNRAFALETDFISSIYEDKEKRLWVGTMNGLYHVKKERLDQLKMSSPKENFQLKFEKHEIATIDPNPEVHDNVTCIYQDDQNLFWVGAQSGLSYYNWYLEQFKFVRNPLLDQKVYIQDNLYIDRLGNFWMQDNEDNCFFFKPNEDKQNLQNFSVPTQETVLGIVGTGDDEIYFVTETSVKAYNIIQKTWRSYTANEEFLKQKKLVTPRKVFVHDGKIWLASYDGLYIINKQTKKFEYHTHDFNNQRTLSDNTLTDIQKDSKGRVWISTFNGLNLVQKDPQGNYYFKRFLHNPDDEFSIPSNRLTKIIESNGQLLIGSFIGLLAYNLETEKFSNYNEGRIQFSIQSMEIIENGNLWGSTSDGLFFFDQNKKSFNFYGKKDGITDGSFLFSSSFVDHNGNIYFGSRKGVTYLNPAEIKTNQKPPAVIISAVHKINPAGEIIEEVVSKDEIILNPDDYNLSIDFSSLNYSRAEKNLYQYKLEGFDENWIPLLKNAKAVYSNLDPGTYTFKVQASNNDGVWNREGDSLSIIKRAAFYETLGFKLLALLFTITATGFGIVLYNRSIIKRNHEMEGLVQERTKALEYKNKEVKILVEKLKGRNDELEVLVAKRTEKIKETNEELNRSNKEYERFAYIASHDLQEPLRTVGSFVNLLDRKYKSSEDENTKKYMHFITDGVKRMSHLIQSLLSYSKVGSGEIQKQETNLNDVVNNKLQDLSKKIKEKNALVTLNSLPTVFCEPDQVGMIFYNLINNAMKFNKKEQPTIAINCDSDAAEGFWKFSVRDNGIGIAPEDQQKIFEVFQRLHNSSEFEGTGIGLATVQKIIAQHGGKIWLESAVGEGTTFYFTIDQQDPSTKVEALEELEVEA